MDFWTPILAGLRALYAWISGSTTTRMIADNGGVVNDRRLDNVTAGSLKMRTETVRGAGNPTSENPVEQRPEAVLTAHDGSAICTDRLTNCTFTGEIDLSTCVKPSQGQ